MEPDKIFSPGDLHTTLASVCVLPHESAYSRRLSIRPTYLVLIVTKQDVQLSRLALWQKKIDEFTKMQRLRLCDEGLMKCFFAKLEILRNSSLLFEIVKVYLLYHFCCERRMWYIIMYRTASSANTQLRF